MKTTPVHQSLETPTERLISSEMVLVHVSKSKANTLNICYDVFFRNCHDFEGVHYCCYEQIYFCFISPSWVRIAARRGGQFCCKFTSVSLCQLSKYNAV